MALAKRNAAKLETKPFHYNPHITVHYEFIKGTDVFVPNDKMKFVGTNGTFTFIKYVHNAELEVDWIDCMDVKTGEFRSFYANRVKPKPKERRKRRKRWQIEAEKAAAAKARVQKTGRPEVAISNVITQGNRVGICSKCKCELNETTAPPSIVRRGSGYCRVCMKAYQEAKLTNGG
jgi:hypothetical protein